MLKNWKKKKKKKERRMKKITSSSFQSWYKGVIYGEELGSVKGSNTKNEFKSFFSSSISFDFFPNMINFLFFSKIV